MNRQVSNFVYSISNLQASLIVQFVQRSSTTDLQKLAEDVLSLIQGVGMHQSSSDLKPTELAPTEFSVQNISQSSCKVSTASTTTNTNTRALKSKPSGSIENVEIIPCSAAKLNRKRESTDDLQRSASKQVGVIRKPLAALPISLQEQIQSKKNGLQSANTSNKWMKEQKSEEKIGMMDHIFLKIKERR